MIIISGMHRSGTTFLGKLLESSGNMHTIHEPFNYKFGLEGVPCWYPIVESLNKSDSKKVKILIDNLVNEKFKFKKETIISDNFFKKKNP